MLPLQYLHASPSREQLYEYRAESLSDNLLGSMNPERLEEYLSEIASEGWRLSHILSNELGVNGASLGKMFFNATMDQIIMIFERPYIDPWQLAQKKNSRPRELYVKNYNLESPLRPVKVLLQNGEHIYVQLQFYEYRPTEIKSLLVDIDFLTVFEEPIPIRDVCALTLSRDEKNKHLLCSDFIQIELEESAVSKIFQANVTIRKSLGKQGILAHHEPVHFCNMSLEALSKIKKYYGIDAVVAPEKMASGGWICRCGTQNYDPRCTLCGRLTPESEAQSEETFFSSLYEEAEALSSASEIFQRFSQIESTPADLKEEMEKLAKSERMYGNMRSSALKIIMQYLEIVDPAE